MELPVFVSCPSKLSQEQEGFRLEIEEKLKHYDLEPITLGRNHKAVSGMAPLVEILHLARHCCGGVVLGFVETQVEGAKRIEEDQAKDFKPIKQEDPINFASVWNQLEAGILLGLGKPVLVCREKGVEQQGILDAQVGDRYIVEFGGKSADFDNSPILAFRSDVVRVYTSTY